LKADAATLSYSKIYRADGRNNHRDPGQRRSDLERQSDGAADPDHRRSDDHDGSTQVSEADVSKLRVGMDAYFTTLGNPNRRFRGTLRQVLPTPTVTNNVVLYTALFDVANPDKQLMPQMTAQVFFVRAGAQDAVLVPVAALQFTGRGAGAVRAQARRRKALPIRAHVQAAMAQAVAAVADVVVQAAAERRSIRNRVATASGNRDNC
jgi:macrolide-specific efflux system membrane fusion protein